MAYTTLQACERQKESWTAARDLTDGLDHFLSVERRVHELRERIETRQVIEKMLDLINESAKFIIEHTSKGWSSTFYLTCPWYSVNEDYRRLVFK